MPFDFLEVLDEMTVDEEDESKHPLYTLFRGKKFLENEKFEEALEIFRKFYEFGKKLYEEDKNEYEIYVVGLTSLAETQRKSGKYQEALKTYDELLRMSREIKDLELEVDTHGMLSETYEEFGEFITESLAHLIQMYEIVKSNSLKSPEYMASLGYNVTERYRLLNDVTKALEYGNETLSYGLKAGSKSGNAVAAVYTSMGRVHLYCGDLAKAEESFKASFTVASNDEKARTAIMDSYLGLVQLAARRNQTDKLEELVEKAENEASKAPASEERENVKVLCRIYNELAALKSETGNFRDADDIIQKSLDLARKSGYRTDQCNCLRRSIEAYISFGEFSKALRCCYEIQEITTPPRYRHLQYMTFSALLSVNKTLGNLDEALENCQKWWESLEIYHSDNCAMKAELLLEFGSVYLGKADFGKDSQKTENLLKAIKYMEKGAEMAEQLEISTLLCETLDALAFAYHSKGELHKALKLAQKARGLKNDSENKPAKADNLKILGGINLSLERFEEAEQNFKEALQLALECEDQKLIAGSYGRLGFIAMKKNDFETAISCFNQSTAITDKLRKGIIQQAQKISFMEISTQNYYALELAYFQCKRYNDALVTSERRRARAFIDMIHAKYWSRGHLSQSLADPSFEKLKMVVDNEKAIFVVFSDYLKSQGEFSIVWLMVPGKSVIAVDVVEMGEFASLIRDLRRMICPNDVVPVRKSRNIQERNIFEEDNLDDADSGSPDVDDLLKQIYQKLFGDIHVRLEKEAGLSGCKSLVIVPSRAMFLLPFAALIMPDGKRMYEKFNLRITASIQALELKENEKESKKKIDTLNVLSVGNPNVPTVKLYGVEKTPLNLDNAEIEAEKVAQLFESQPLIYNDATKEAVLSRLPSADLVHFACHGSWQYKALLLAPSNSKKQKSDEYTEEHVLLTAGEVLELDLKAKLVVLSACNSGTGELNSEGVVGLTRSFLGAGALAVIAALWLLPDEATQLFMEKFYISWKSGKLASESLREATESIRSIAGFNHPYFWAPFVLMGHDIRLEL